MQIHCIHTTVPILTEVKATTIKTESVQAWLNKKEKTTLKIYQVAKTQSKLR